MDSSRPDAIDQDTLAAVGVDVVVGPRHPDPAAGAQFARLALAGISEVWHNRMYVR